MTELIIDYQEKDGYCPIYINGAFGGRSARGEIILHFFSEENTLPTSERYLIDDGNISLKQSEDQKDIKVIRRVNCGIIMTEKSAKEVYEWLGKVLEGSQ